MSLYLAEFPGHGRALFTTLDAAMDWCDTRLESQWPGQTATWSEAHASHTPDAPGQIGQERWHQVWPADAAPARLPGMRGTVVALTPDIEIKRMTPVQP